MCFGTVVLCYGPVYAWISPIMRAMVRLSVLIISIMCAIGVHEYGIQHTGGTQRGTQDEYTRREYIQ